jgi:hypothetical protein
MKSEGNSSNNYWPWLHIQGRNDVCFEDWMNLVLGDIVQNLHNFILDAGGK